MKENTYWIVLKDFPSSAINSSREIVKKYLELFNKYKNPFYAKVLEDFGIELDYSPLDNGN